MSNKLNTLFPKVTEYFTKASQNKPTEELIIPSSRVLAAVLEKGLTPKELHFFHSVENREFTGKVYTLPADDLLNFSQLLKASFWWE